MQVFNNDSFSQMTSSYNVIELLVKDQISSLNTEYGKHLTKFNIAEKHGGFKPFINQETDLVKRCKVAGFSHYIIKSTQISEEDYKDALDVGEERMTKLMNNTHDHRKLIRCCLKLKSLFFSEKKFDPVSLEEASTTLNLSASAGFPYYQKKGKVLSQLLQDARVTPFNEWRYFPTMRSFRPQFKDKSGKIVPLPRVIYPYPGLITLLEMRYVRPVVDYCIKNSSLPYVTGRSGRYVSERILTAKSKYTSYISTDISKFDQNMPNEVIIAAFSVLRSVFRFKSEDAKEFEQLAAYFCSSYLSSRVGTDNSKTIIKVKGIPSGTGFTNLVGTLCHCLLLLYFDIDWFDKNESYICSDDNLSFTSEFYTLDTLSLIYRRWGLEYKPSETVVSNDLSKIFFLGFNWIQGKRVINPRLAINQLVYHSMYIDESIMTPYMRILSRAASVLFNGINGKFYFNKIFPDVNVDNTDIPYYFLPTYQPATSSSLITGRFRGTRASVSLKEHYYNGWLIR